MFEEILRTTSALARCLQGKILDLASALHQIENVEIKFATAMRDVVLPSSPWQTIRVTDQSIISKMELPKPVPRFFRKTRYQTAAEHEIPNTEDDYFIFAFFSIQLSPD